MIRRVRAAVHRLISTAILLGWLAPNIGALGVGLHVASEHHDPHGIEQQQAMVDLVVAATHGHHHELDDAPDHHHEARIDGQASAYRPALSVLTVLPKPSSSSAVLPEGSTLDRSRRRGPPTPLFAANCSLLI